MEFELTPFCKTLVNILPKLEILDLSNNKLADTAVFYLVEILINRFKQKPEPSLKVLSLSGNLIKDPGVIFLEIMLKSTRFIEALDLRFNCIQREGQELAREAWEGRSIENLRLTGQRPKKADSGNTLSF